MNLWHEQQTQDQLTWTSRRVSRAVSRSGIPGITGQTPDELMLACHTRVPVSTKSPDVGAWNRAWRLFLVSILFLSSTPPSSAKRAAQTQVHAYLHPTADVGWGEL